MSEIIPAIVPKSFSDLEEKLSIIADRVPMAHVDVTNSTLTPNSAWPYEGDVSEFLKIVDEVEGFPFWEELSFEAHLMVKNPEEIIEDWIRAGAERLILHLESFNNPDQAGQTLALLKNRFDSSSSYLGIETGLAVHFETPLDSIFPLVPQVDFVHLMSIKKIGGQGEPFELGIFDRIKELKAVFPETIISVDGGVTLATAEELLAAGVDRLVVGSAIFANENPEMVLADFLEIAKTYGSN